MKPCLLVSDLHGRVAHYRKLFDAIARVAPRAVFLAGDLLPSGLTRASSSDPAHHDFVTSFLAVELERLREGLGARYPDLYVILGNDDGRLEEAAVVDVASRGLWHYAHNRRHALGDHAVYGYAYIPPSPFQLKDWERYDVGRYVDPGCVSPEEGRHSVPVSAAELRNSTIEEDLRALLRDEPLDRAVLLFHAPPYRTKLDRAALDGKRVDHVPLDVHVGSIAIRRLIETRQPLLTLHGHVHESARLTRSWSDRIGRTLMLSAAHDGPELALVRFDLDDPGYATRDLL